MKARANHNNGYLLPGTELRKVDGCYLADWEVTYQDDRIDIGRSYVGQLEQHAVGSVDIGILKLMHDGNCIRRHDELLEELVSTAFAGEYKLLCRNKFNDEIYFVAGDSKNIDEYISRMIKDDRICYDLGPALLSSLVLKCADGKVIAEGEIIDCIANRVAHDLTELNKNDSFVKRVKLCTNLREHIEDLAFQLEYKRAQPKRASQFGVIKGITTVTIGETIVNIAETPMVIDTKFVFLAGNDGKPITGIAISRNHFMFMASGDDSTYAQDTSCLIDILGQPTDVIVL